MKLKLATNTLHRIFTIIGALVLLFIVIGSWLPTSCPLVRRAIVSCPSKSGPLTFPKTDVEREIARIPHQEIYSDRLEVTVKGQEKRNKTLVHFFHLDTAGHVVAMLQLKNPDGTFRDLSLITHRALLNLTWPAITTNEARLFQESATYTSIEELIANPPAANRLAADAAAAAEYGLQTSQYTPLEKLEKLDGISYVLTTFTPGASTDGMWKSFDHTYDFSNAPLTESGEYTLIIRVIQGYSIDDAFRVATVHVDYAKSNQ